ncbi:MAG: DUF4276 family protein [Pseudomonadota bacterium]
MKTLVFFLEEPSAEEMLKGVIPRILPDGILSEYKVFEGKQDMEKRMPKILRAWRKPDCLFIVMRDQDSGDCDKVKSKLMELCREAGREGVLVRVACRELECFYLGDLAAVEKGLGLSGLAVKQQGRKFRDPDHMLGNPSEELIKLTENTYQKIAGSRAIGPYLSLTQNRSTSFKNLLSGVRKLMAES